MKKLWMLIYLSVLFLIASACNNSQEPQIIVEAVVSELNEDEYDYVGTKGLEDPRKEDFRKFTFNFEVKHATNALRKVEFPERNIWKEAINTIDSNKGRYWFGGGHDENTDNEGIARYRSEFVFYSKGLNEEEIRQAFNSISLELYLDTQEEIIEEEYKIRSLIQFNNDRSS